MPVAIATRTVSVVGDMAAAFKATPACPPPTNNGCHEWGYIKMPLTTPSWFMSAKPLYRPLENGTPN